MTTPHDGYYRFPTLHQDRIVYVCEDDLWSVSAAGGISRRLTAGLGAAGFPVLSPDGRWIAFTGRETGDTEVYLLGADGGVPRRLTHLGASTFSAAWSRDSRTVIAATDAGQAFRGFHHLVRVPRSGGPVQPIRVGPARAIAFEPGGRGRVIGRNMRDPAHWKRYRGGTAGTLWIDRRGRGGFARLCPELKSNLARPIWICGRVYFLSDHEGHANLYSCDPAGADVRRHTDHEGLYARWPSSDGRRIVYHVGGDVWLFDPASGETHRVPIEHHGPRTQCATRFVSASRYLESFDPHPDGRAVALTVRGRSVGMGAWEGAVTVQREHEASRHRLTAWLRDGKRLVTLSDEGGEESLWVIGEDGEHRRVPTRMDLGRIYEMRVAPAGADRVAASNHRFELLVIHLNSGRTKVIDQSRYAMIGGFDWSADGRWLAYSFAAQHRVSIIKLAQPAAGKTANVTRPDFLDVCPSFDPKGSFLYFLSYRDFDPVYDNITFDLNFPTGVRPFLVTLREDVKSPFIPEPRPLHEKDDDDGDGKSDVGGKTKTKTKTKKKKKKTNKKDVPERLRIDLKGIEDRVLGIPVSDGRYAEIVGIEGKILFTEMPIEGAMGSTLTGEPGEAQLFAWDLKERKRELLAEGVSEMAASLDRKTLLYRSGRRLRLCRAGEKPEKPDEGGDEPGRKSGWLDLGRVRVAIDPIREWQQMYREAWRLQRDHYWTEDMGGIDWRAVHDRYYPLVSRAASRSEFSDLLWEMQGELGTSHAYELGGDYRKTPSHRGGKLGADLRFNGRSGAWRIERILRGDGWEPGHGAPLRQPGLDVREGDVLLSVAGRKVGRDLSPAECLANLAGEMVEVRLGRARRKRPVTVTVKTLVADHAVRYRDWVEANRAEVHRRSRGRVGYVHIPDMGPRGYAEFHRYFQSEVDRDGLLVDLRWNGGGHVSQLILEKLLRKRVGYDFPRWGEAEPYPLDSVPGPLVALTNEYAGSDGDIFCHCFKLYGLGPLVGKRTWGGVVGIWPRQALVDGTVTTQPEYSFWFEDVGWGVENYGTDPDIEVDNTPQDHAKGRDAQLLKALDEMKRLLRERPPKRPKRPDGRPNLAPPRLPRR